jgi:hypothetical protein
VSEEMWWTKPEEAWRMTRVDLDALASLTHDQRHAVLMALLEWHDVAKANDHHECASWSGFDAAVMHSAALRRRLLGGHALFVERPPLSESSYPNYKLMEDAGAPLRIRPPDEHV